ncbi:hypothetical protein E8E14_007858 [Neopestalotiopsis sp. 37M]|nr:hypothetical protein E8E14_007858 [Neopestalotiopsis sp. 37M]
MASSPISSSQLEEDVELSAHARVSQLTDKDFREKPWKYIGYRGYTNFLSSDDDMFILRRFKALNVRVILEQQDKISVLEQSLTEIDDRNSKIDAPDVNNGTIRDDLKERKLLLDDISKEIYRYNEDKLVLQQTRLLEYPVAPERDVIGIKNWHKNHGGLAIVTDEQEYLDRQDDLVCITHKSKTPLRKVIDKSRRMRTLEIWKRKDGNRIPPYDTEHVALYSDQRIDNFASVVIVLIGLIMLVTPIWTLNAVGSMQSRLVIITVFTVVFLLVMSFAMVAKPFEALGATAAYAAVLMVFMQLGSD